MAMTVKNLKGKIKWTELLLVFFIFGNCPGR